MIQIVSMPANSEASRFLVNGGHDGADADGGDLLAGHAAHALAAGEQVDGQRRQHRWADVAQRPHRLGREVADRRGTGSDRHVTRR